MIFFIDTTDANRIFYALVDTQVFSRSFGVDPRTSHKTVAMLQRFLKSHAAKNSAITEIVACKGPGSYTGTRVGVAHAMALGLAWNVPVRFVAKNRIPKDLRSLKK